MKFFVMFLSFFLVFLFLQSCAIPSTSLNAVHKDETKGKASPRVEVKNPPRHGDSKKEYVLKEEPGKKENKKKTVKIVKSELKAGSHNDNEQFIRYLEYLERPIVQNLGIKIPNLRQRYIIQVKDKKKRPIPNCELNIATSSGRSLGTYKTTSSGEVILFPNATEHKMDSEHIVILGKYHENVFEYKTAVGEMEVINVQTNFLRDELSKPSLDIVFTIDTTGSMGDEIQKLKDTLFSIHHRITSMKYIKPQVRFGMVLYKDRGDAYITKVVKLTSDLEQFQMQLQEVTAGGGGDYPEEMDQALYKTITEQPWNKNGIRMTFLITDAPPHLNRSKPDYVWSMQEAARKGIRIYGVGASGLNNLGEYVLRQIAVFTGGHYIFLTYGESGESSSSGVAKVSHHTGSNYETEFLDTLIVKMIKSELSYVVDPALIMEEEIPVPEKINASTLDERIKNISDQLFYQVKKHLKNDISIAICPFDLKIPVRLRNVATYVQDGLQQNMKQSMDASGLKCKLLDRENIRKAFQERMLASSENMDEKEYSSITKVQGAQIFLTGKIYPLGKSVVLFMKLIDVKTLQKLAVARVLWTPQ